MITIHIGLHKTGSSSIQFALRSIDAHQYGPIIVPQPGVGSSDELLRANLMRLRAAGRGVLSDENVIGQPFDGYAAMDRRLALLADVLGGTPTRVVVYLRPQHSWLASVFVQLVQQGQGADAERFWAAMRGFENLDWTILLARLRAALPSAAITALAYTGGDVVEDFLRQAGLPPVRTGAPIEENVSIAPVQVPLLAAVNATIPPGPDQARVRACFQTVLGPGARRNLSVFPEDVQSAITAAYRDRWQVLTDTADGSARPAFQRGLDTWPPTPVPSAGTSLDDPAVQAEAIRALSVLTSQAWAGSPGLVQRTVTWVRRSPRTAPARAWRRITRRRTA